jgi:hypothetical protein
MSKNSIRERITRSEERISEIQSSLNEIKDNCKTIIANIEKLESMSMKRSQALMIEYPNKMRQ